MVCDSCEKKLSTVCVPDKWKEGARNISGGKVVGKTNKILQNLSKSQYIPEQSACRLCQSKVMPRHAYCNDCAHKKGICTMCGKKTVDVSRHRMSLK